MVTKPGRKITINEPAIRIWVEALRSGEYTQGRCQLCDRDLRFCCLGVACDVLGDGWWVQRSDGDWQYTADENAERGLLSSFPPSEISRALGITPPDGNLFNQAARWNDVEGWSFERIAEELEREYLT